MFGLSEPAAIFYFLVTLVQLVAVVIWVDISTLGWTPHLDGALDVSSRLCIGHLVSMVHWMSGLDGALDISDMMLRDIDYPCLDWDSE